MSESGDLEAIKAQLQAIHAELAALKGALQENPPSRPALTSTPSRRRWWRFSLRSMLVAVAIFACWLGYQMTWIVQRRALMNHPGVTVNGYVAPVPEKTPWIVRFLDERELAAIAVPAELHRRAVRLFPEAMVASPAAPPLDLTKYQTLPLAPSVPQQLSVPQQAPAPQQPSAPPSTMSQPPVSQLPVSQLPRAPQAPAADAESTDN